MSICCKLGSFGLVKQRVLDISIFLLQIKIIKNSNQIIHLILQSKHDVWIIAFLLLIVIFIMLNLLRRISIRPYSFATTRDAVNYYKILEVESGATEQAIRKAYAELTENIKPELDIKQYKTLNEAFVILTDNKTRDAYDSLLAVKKTFYNSPEPSKPPTTKSYLSTRKMSKEQALKKKANIDQFGRYKGGLPRTSTLIRGRSLGQTGALYRQDEIEEQFDQNPEFHNITAEKAESFKNFHQDERKARTMKWPWFTFEVDYEYFTFRNFRVKYWPKIQLFIFLFYILPTLFYAVQTFQKKYYKQQLKAIAEAKLKIQQEAAEAKDSQA